MPLSDNTNCATRSSTRIGAGDGSLVHGLLRDLRAGSIAMAWMCCTGMLCFTGTSLGQTARLPSGSSAPLSQSMVPRGGSPVDIPQTNLTPIGQPGFSAPGFAGPPGFSGPPRSATLGNPVFDPYNSGQGAGAYQPAFAPGALPSSNPNASGGLLGGLFSQAPAAPVGYGPYGGGATPNYGQPSYAPPPTYNPTPSYGSPYGGAPGFATAPPPGAAPLSGPGFNAPSYGANPGYGAPSYPNTIYPSGAPSTLFPGGMFGSAGFNGASNSGFSAYRLLQGPRLRHTFINAGDGQDDLQINDTDASIAFAFPNFLYSNQPIYVVPSFSLHLWDGPQSTSGADLPGSAFDAFLDVGWQSDPNQMFGAELGARVGVFSDFDAISSDSLRVMGKGLLSFRLTPAATLKGGAYFINREERQFVPAFGLLYQPNPYTRLDIYFPEPKFATYLRTLGTYDVWGYVTGEYGGGVWTIKRDSGEEDIVDMYDYKIAAGLEWGESNAIRVGRRTAFAEIGYVFNRELKYQSKPDQTFDLNEGFFVRAGFGY